jgi:hypothetical protein
MPMSSVHPWVAFALVSAISPSGCGEGGAPATPAPPPPSAEAHTPGIWRYGAQMQRTMGATPFEIVLEVSSGARGRAWVVAAVQRTAAARPAVTLEVWTFEQRQDDVEPVGEPQVLVRARPTDPRPDAHDQLRRDLAAPGVVVHRPLGVDAKDATTLVEQLAAHARTSVDPEADDAARVSALAELVRGLDDTLVFEHDRLAKVRDLLAAPGLQLDAPEEVSARRTRVPLRGPGARQVVEVWAKGDGRVIAELYEPDPDAQPG